MSLDEAFLLADVRERLFSPTTSSRGSNTVGAEFEMFPVDARTRRPIPAIRGSRTSAAVLKHLAPREGWIEHQEDDDPPAWELPDGSRVSFEPGGQIEISSAPHRTASSLIDSLEQTATLLKDAMTPEQIELITLGIDPFNTVDDVPLQLHRQRYTRMTEYFDTIGPAGVRMMRQTNALQIAIEKGPDPLARWRLLNALVPVVVALFANSRQYAQRDTGFASYRAQLWRELDPSRTGIPYDRDDPAGAYLRFALDATMMRRVGVVPEFKSFRDWLQRGEISEADWEFHLSTLFPEVRPRDYFELRSCDSIEVKWVSAPIVFVTAIVYDEHSATAATRLLGAPSEELLQRAGRLGLHDPELRRLARELTALALDGARRLTPDYVRNNHVQSARDYFDRVLAEA